MQFLSIKIDFSTECGYRKRSLYEKNLWNMEKASFFSVLGDIIQISWEHNLQEI